MVITPSSRRRKGPAKSPAVRQARADGTVKRARRAPRLEDLPDEALARIISHVARPSRRGRREEWRAPRDVLPLAATSRYMRRSVARAVLTALPWRWEDKGRAQFSAWVRIAGGDLRELAVREVSDALLQDLRCVSVPLVSLNVSCLCKAPGAHEEASAAVSGLMRRSRRSLRTLSLSVVNTTTLYAACAANFVNLNSLTVTGFAKEPEAVRIGRRCFGAILMDLLESLHATDGPAPPTLRVLEVESPSREPERFPFKDTLARLAPHLEYFTFSCKHAVYDDDMDEDSAVTESFLSQASHFKELRTVQIAGAEVSYEALRSFSSADTLVQLEIASGCSLSGRTVDSAETLASSFGDRLRFLSLIKDEPLGENDVLAITKHCHFIRHLSLRLAEQAHHVLPDLCGGQKELTALHIYMSDCETNPDYNGFKYVLEGFESCLLAVREAGKSLRNFKFCYRRGLTEDQMVRILKQLGSNIQTLELQSVDAWAKIAALRYAWLYNRNLRQFNVRVLGEFPPRGSIIDEMQEAFNNLEAVARDLKVCRDPLAGYDLDDDRNVI